MSVGFLAILEGPAPEIEELRAHVERRLHQIPRYRQRLAHPPAGLGRPVWVDDELFDVAFHVRRAVVSPPGGERELCALHAGIFARRLDRTRPLWELHLVEGLADGRFAIVSKHHHALNDGVSTIHVIASIWDFEAEPESDRYESGWRPAPPPSGLSLLASGAVELAQDSAAAALQAAGAAAQPQRLGRRLMRGIEGVVELGRAIATPAPDTPINAELGPERAFAAPRYPLDQMKLAKDRLGATINDVMLTMVAGGLADLFHARGLPTEGVELRPIVPVSLRAAEQDGTLGNRVVTMRPALPLGIEDPVARLRAVGAELERLKRSTQPTVVEVLEGAMNWVPPQALGPIARLAYHPRLFNVLVSNIPGPQFPLYLLGREAETFHVCGFLAPEHTLSIAAGSYMGVLGVGLIADPARLPELDLVVEGMDRTLAELVAAAKGGAGAGTNGAGRTARTARAPDTR